MLLFNFILGLNFIFLYFKLIIIHYHIPKQRSIKFRPSDKIEPQHIYFEGPETKNSTITVLKLALAKHHYLQDTTMIRLSE